MTAEPYQLYVDLDSPAEIARAYRAAAETALHDPYFTESDRRERHDHYMREAQRLEALA